MIYIDLKNVAGYFNEYFVYIMVGVMMIDFILGTTSIVYGNSIIECVLRMFGWTTLRVFKLRYKKLDKRKGRVR